MLADRVRVSSGKKEPEPIYFYDLGLYSNLWNEGYQTGTGSVAKYSKSLRLSVAGEFFRRSLNRVVDITNINTLYVDWTLTGANGKIGCYLALINNTGDNPIASSKRTQFMSMGHSRVITELDVSSSSGFVYISLLIDGAYSSVGGNLDIYQVWGL